MHPSYSTVLPKGRTRAIYPFGESSAVSWSRRQSGNCWVGIWQHNASASRTPFCALVPCGAGRVRILDRVSEVPSVPSSAVLLFWPPSPLLKLVIFGGVEVRGYAWILEWELAARWAAKTHKKMGGGGVCSLSGKQARSEINGKPIATTCVFVR